MKLKLAIVLFLLISSVNVLEIKGFIDSLKCLCRECCKVKLDFMKLENDLKSHIYGQPLVQNNLVSAIKSHFSLKSPNKALVLSFHGGTGTGKNYVSQLIANSLFEKGLDSKFVHIFVASRDFTHNYFIDRYRNAIRQMIETKLKKCKYSLFIFDETDKIPISLIDVIRSYIDVNPQIEGIDPRNSVFIFLSNTGSKVINNKALELINKNISIEEFQLKMFRQNLEEYLYSHKMNDSKGMWHSTLISNQLIDHYIPFLPMQKKDVVKCIESEFEKYKVTNKEYIDEILNELIYEEADESVIFSKYGCKRITSLVRKLLIEKEIEVKLEF